MVAAFCLHLPNQLDLLTHFLPILKDLLIYSEPLKVLEFYEQKRKVCCRFLILRLFENIMQVAKSSCPIPLLWPHEIYKFIVQLSTINLNQSHLTIDQRKETLHSWQALCVFSSYLPREIILPLVDNFFIFLREASAYDSVEIYVFLEVFGSNVTVQHTDIVLPLLLKQFQQQLRRKHTNAFMNSLLVIFGHIFSTKKDIILSHEPIIRELLIALLQFQVSVSNETSHTLGKFIMHELLQHLQLHSTLVYPFDGIWETLTSCCPCETFER